MKSLMLIVAALLGVSSALSQTSEGREKMRTISVRGEGTIATTPDQVRLTVQVSAKGQTATDAMRSASTRTSQILALLKTLGVDEKNIQTSRVNVSPTFDYSKQIQPPPIIGYNSSNDFAVVFKQKLMDNVGEFMDKAVAAGATGFGGLQYEASNQRELERTALTKAAADARARADVLARELNASLGQVFTVSESVSGGRPVPMMMRSVDASSAAPVMSGELAITAQVDVVFELK